MLFNSYPFIFIYLPITFIGMFWLARYSHRLAALWLAMASIVFYGVWNIDFVQILLGSIAFNYGMGCGIGFLREFGAVKRAKYGLFFGVFVNLSLLLYFKYANFFVSITNVLLGADVPLLDIILPLGISFFTFTQIAFLVDVYRGVAREVNFIHYLLFVTYFPHLIAGPVLHHKQMMPQFAKPATYRINAEHVAVGLTIFVLGLAKKVLIADNLAEYANQVFWAARDGQVLLFIEAWIGALAYTLQLYFDFSGYSDMAIGISLMFNVRLPLNFDSPYKAGSIIDFWRRWHMTLSAFLRDYLYFSLGGNRQGPTHRYLNLMVTMLLGGLWHGAGWTFIVWGGLHGIYLMVNHAWRNIKVLLSLGDGGYFGRMFSVFLTFVAVVVAWVFFRADSISSAYSIISSMFGINEATPGKLGMSSRAINLIIPTLVLVWFFPNVRQMLLDFCPTWNDMVKSGNSSSFTTNRLSVWLRWEFTLGKALILGFLFCFCALSLTKVSEFLYFQF